MSAQRRIIPVRLDEMPVRPGDRREMACPDGYRTREAALAAHPDAVGEEVVR